MSPGKFKSIVQYKTSHELSVQLKNKTAQDATLQNFSTNEVDEIQQIIPMSDKTVVVTDNIFALEKLRLGILRPELGKFNICYLDWAGELSQREISNLRSQNISVFAKLEIEVVISKIEIYLWGLN